MARYVKKIAGALQRKHQHPFQHLTLHGCVARSDEGSGCCSTAHIKSLQDRSIEGIGSMTDK
jgi:hypothetical protein